MNIIYLSRNLDNIVMGRIDILGTQPLEHVYYNM